MRNDFRNTDWMPQPHLALRKYPNGTMFLLWSRGLIHACQLDGNIEGDTRWKALRLSDGRIIVLDKSPMAQFALIHTNKVRGVWAIRTSRDGEYERLEHYQKDRCEVYGYAGKLSVIYGPDRPGREYTMPGYGGHVTVKPASPIELPAGCRRVTKKEAARWLKAAKLEAVVKASRQAP